MPSKTHAIGNMRLQNMLPRMRCKQTRLEARKRNKANWALARRMKRRRASATVKGVVSNFIRWMLDGHLGSRILVEIQHE